MLPSSELRLQWDYKIQMIYLLFIIIIITTGFSSSHGCESWTIKKAEHRRTDVFALDCWRFLKVPWTSGDQISQF